MTDVLAVEPLWQHCVDAGAGDHRGTTIRDTADGLVVRGQPLEAHWPYNRLLGDASEDDPPCTAAVDWHGGDVLALGVAHDEIEDDIETAVGLGLPVVVLAELTDEFDHPGPDGEIEVPPITSPLSDYHAVVAVGAATSSDGSTRRLLIRNSWGPSWGAGGYGWMPLGYLTAFAVDAAVIDPRAMYSR